MSLIRSIVIHLVLNLIAHHHLHHSDYNHYYYFSVLLKGMLSNVYISDYLKSDKAMGMSINTE